MEPTTDPTKLYLARLYRDGELLHVQRDTLDNIAHLCRSANLPADILDGEQGVAGMSQSGRVRWYDICPRCSKPQPNVGPWSGPPAAEFTRLCGPCKAHVCLATKEQRDRLAFDGAQFARAAGVSATVEVTPPVDPAKEG